MYPRFKKNARNTFSNVKFCSARYWINIRVEVSPLSIELFMPIFFSILQTKLVIIETENLRSLTLTGANSERNP